jgi:hypothetical protein
MWRVFFLNYSMVRWRPNQSSRQASDKKIKVPVIVRASSSSTIVFRYGYFFPDGDDRASVSRDLYFPVVCIRSEYSCVLV